MKTFYIFIGAQGSGKSSLYNYFMSKEDLGVRINLDEIIKENNLNPKILKDTFALSKILVRQLCSCIENGENFNFETAYISKSLLKYIKLAKSKGFRIQTFFVGLQNLDLHIERIKARVSIGGHDVDSKLVEENFKRRFINMPELLQLSDSILFYDNTHIMKKIASFQKNKFLYIDKTNPIVCELLQHINVTDAEMSK